MRSKEILFSAEGAPVSCPRLSTRLGLPRLVNMAGLIHVALTSAACLLLGDCARSSPPPPPTISSSNSTSPKGVTGLAYSVECGEDLQVCHNYVRGYCPSGHTILTDATQPHDTLTFECK